MANKTAISSIKKSTIAKPENKKSTPSAFTATVKKSLKDKKFIRAFAAEGVGTFLFVIAFLQMQSSPLFVAFATVGILLVVGGTGLHLNPAVTIGAWVTKKIDWAKAAANIIAQALGTALAYLTLTAFINGAGTTTTASIFHAAKIVEGSEWYILLAEFLGTAIIAFGFATALKAKKTNLTSAFTAGFAILIGLYLAMSLTTILLSESYTALSFMNPAIAFAANGISWSLWPMLTYILAPVVGGVLGFAVQDLLKSDTCECDCNC